MIPVITTTDGETFAYQVMNDNLTAEEQINRLLLAAITCPSVNLTNIKDEISRKIGNAEYDSTKLDDIKSAAETLVKSLNTAIDTFTTAIA